MRISDWSSDVCSSDLLAQATVRPQGAEEQNSPLATLIDPARLGSDFNVAETGAQGGLDWLELTPKEEDNATFQRARLGFDDNGLARMEVVDMLGQRTETAFSDWKKNLGFAEGTFRSADRKSTRLNSRQQCAYRMPLTACN